MDQSINSVEALLSTDNHHSSKAALDLLKDIDFNQFVDDPARKQDLPPACTFLDVAFKPSNSIKLA